MEIAKKVSTLSHRILPFAYRFWNASSCGCFFFFGLPFCDFGGGGFGWFIIAFGSPWGSGYPFGGIPSGPGNPSGSWDRWPWLNGEQGGWLLNPDCIALSGFPLVGGRWLKSWGRGGCSPGWRGLFPVECEICDPPPGKFRGGDDNISKCCRQNINESFMPKWSPVVKIRLQCVQLKHETWYTNSFACITISLAWILLLHRAHTAGEGVEGDLNLLKHAQIWTRWNEVIDVL